MNKKRININSKYKSKISFDDYSLVNDILISYYLPLIKPEALVLYQLLIIDSKNPMINSLFISIERIVSLINLSIDSIENAIIKLELVNLIEVFKDSDNKIIFSLKRPMNPSEINESFQMLELLKSSIGNENLQIINKLFNSLKQKENFGFETTTKEINLSIKEEIPEGSLNINFDFNSIKNILISRGINWSLFWSDNLEKKLLNFIIVYKITSFDIALEFIKEIDTGKFSSENLIKRINDNFFQKRNIDSIILSGEKTTENKLNFLSKFSVEDYFMYKLNRMPSPSEEEMITKLVNKYAFSNHQINILIDYSIIVNEGAINKNYIYKIAETSIKENIDTAEKLIQHLKVSYKMKKNNKKNKSLDSKIEMEDKPIF